MGLLDGGLAPLVRGAFGWVLLNGEYISQTQTDDGKGGLNEADATPIPIKVMTDPENREVREAEGFNPLTDAALLFLALGVNGEAVPYPKPKDHVIVDGVRYHLMEPIRRDAAKTHYTARGRAIDAEAEEAS